MTQETEANKKAAPTEAAKTQPKPKVQEQQKSNTKSNDSVGQPQEEVYTPTSVNEAPATPYLPNKAWLILLPIAFVGTITTVSLIFTGSNSSYQQRQLQQLETEYKGYQTGVKDAR